MYAYNNRHRDSRKYNSMIISPNVCVFRNLKDELLDEPFLTAVVTIPAPNKKGGARNIPQDDIDAVMKYRLKNMFAAAAHFGYKNLVLGAWGCGAFGHDPEVVSKYFYELLIDENFGSYFDEIVFAVLDKGEKKNFEAFRATFDPLEEMMIQQVKLMDSALNRFELPESIVLHKLADISLLRFFKNVRTKGGFFQDNGFTDTSAVRVDAPNKNYIEVEILVPAGKGRGAWLAPNSPFPEECQFTLCRGTIYEVREIVQSDSGIWRVTVLAVGKNPKELN